MEVIYSCVRHNDSDIIAHPQNYDFKPETDK